MHDVGATGKPTAEVGLIGAEHGRGGAELGSNRAMADTPDTTDARLTELEIKASYAEDQIDQLNQAIYRQQQQIDLLLREVSGLRRQLPEGSTPVLASLRDELPPHY
jgi:SlyX protein